MIQYGTLLVEDVIDIAGSNPAVPIKEFSKSLRLILTYDDINAIIISDREDLDSYRRTKV